jgi:transcriptional regulator with XRE-family HTH domain
MVTDSIDATEAVAAELRAERAAARLTVEELAERSGVHRGTLLRYLNAKRDIPVSTLIQIAEGLNIAPHLILERAAERMSEKRSNVTPLRSREFTTEQIEGFAGDKAAHRDPEMDTDED